MSDLTFDGAMQLFDAQQSDPFPVDFDLAWQWLGYSTKGNAKRFFESAGFVVGVDFEVFINTDKNPAGGRPSEGIRLAVDCFKQWGMMSGTEQGKQVRRYFLECERIAKLKATAPNLQDVADPFWNLIDNAMARQIEPERAIDLHHRFSRQCPSEESLATASALPPLVDNNLKDLAVNNIRKNWKDSCFSKRQLCRTSRFLMKSSVTEVILQDLVSEGLLKIVKVGDRILYRL